MRLCVIPARGGSKRIPRKNIKSFCGQAMISYSIKAALESKCFDQVIVSTDDAEIAKVSKLFGAEILFIRPEELSDDFTGTNDVVKHAINWFIEHNIVVDYACCIYATAPFVNQKYLKEGFEKLQSSNKSFAFSVTSFGYSIQKAFKINNNAISMFYPQYLMSRSQDLENAYHDAGQFYWGKAQAFLDNEVMFSDKTIPVVLPRYLVQDIDTLEDWDRAELMYKALN